MFPDSKIARKFSIHHSKMSYVISHGLGPYFCDQLIKDIKNCERFVLYFDEQTRNNVIYIFDIGVHKKDLLLPDIIVQFY